MLPPEITFIQRGWFNSNMVLLRGSRGTAVIDTGHLLDQNQTIDLIRQQGVEPETICHIALTHGHSDHHGGNRLLKQLSGATIGMGATTAAWFARPEHGLLWADHLGQEMDIVPADVIYQPEQRLDLVGIPFQTIAIPGHAPDALAYYQPDTRVMICADAVWAGGDVGVLNTAVHGWGILDEAEAAVRRLQGYEVAVALPGHGGVITDWQGETAVLLERLASFRAQPAKLANHVVRRFLMYILLRYQPIGRAELTELALAGPWLRHYAPLCAPERTAAQLLTTLLDTFAERGLIHTENGLLVSQIKR